MDSNTVPQEKKSWNKKLGNDKPVIIGAVVWIAAMVFAGRGEDRAGYFWALVLLGPALGTLVLKDKVRHRWQKSLILFFGILLAVIGFVVLVSKLPQGS